MRATVRATVRAVARTIAGPFRTAYVIDCRQAGDGYLFRAPRFVAAAFCRVVAEQARYDSRVAVQAWDHAPTPEGY